MLQVGATEGEEEKKKKKKKLTNKSFHKEPDT
jgi:hypothetical protein